MESPSKVKEFIEEHNMLKDGEHVLVGVSGGADSVALLYLLLCMKSYYRIKLSVAHINHGIRREAAADEEFVRKLCDRYGIPFKAYYGDIPAMAKEQGESLETVGRQFRYQCFAREMERIGADKLSVAHHKGDLVETTLFHLVRGTGMTGMTGIRPVAEMPWGTIIRPLLCLDKSDITSMLRNNKIPWREDVTNGDDRYTRNKLRNKVLPLLTEINKGAVDHILEFSKLAVQYEDMLNGQVDKYIDKYVKKADTEVSFDRKRLREQSPLLANAIIYKLYTEFAGQKKDISRVHVDAIFDLLDKKTGKKIDLPYDVSAEVVYKDVVFRRRGVQTDVLPSFEKRIDMSEVRSMRGIKVTESLPDGRLLHFSITRAKGGVSLPKNNYTKCFACDTIKDVLSVRKVDKGDYLIINDAGEKKSLSRYFIDNKVPREKRSEAIVLARESEVLWIVGDRRCENYKVNDETCDILWIEVEGEANGQY